MKQARGSDDASWMDKSKIKELFKDYNYHLFVTFGRTNSLTAPELRQFRGKCCLPWVRDSAEIPLTPSDEFDSEKS